MEKQGESSARVLKEKDRSICLICTTLEWEREATEGDGGGRFEVEDKGGKDSKVVGIKEKAVIKKKKLRKKKEEETKTNVKETGV